MQDLNDFRLFVEVVDQKGFAAAARRLGVPRSLLSRRIAMLEEAWACGWCIALLGALPSRKSVANSIAIAWQ
jgi:hypothetical protein